MSRMIRKLKECPVIAALKDTQSAQLAANNNPQVCFILGGDILTVPKILGTLKDAGKAVFVHIDMINGLGADKAAVKFISRKWKPDGIITTRKGLIKCAKDDGLTTVQRIFLLDSTSIVSGIKMINSADPDIVEVVPGVISKAISEIRKNVKQQVIAGGMITELSEASNALKAGAIGISTSRVDLWNSKLLGE